MIKYYGPNKIPCLINRGTQLLGGVAIAIVTALNPNVVHADDLGPSSPTATASPSPSASPIPSETAQPRLTASASPSIEAIATASPSPTASLIPSETALPTPSASAEATATTTPTPQPSKIVVGVDDPGLYPTGPKPTDLVPVVPLEPGSAHPTHGQTHHIYGSQHFVKPNQLPATGLPIDVLAGLGAASLATGIAFVGLKRPK